MDINFGKAAVAFLYILLVGASFSLFADKNWDLRVNAGLAYDSVRNETLSPLKYSGSALPSGCSVSYSNTLLSIPLSAEFLGSELESEKSSVRDSKMNLTEIGIKGGVLVNLYREHTLEIYAGPLFDLRMENVQIGLSTFSETMAFHGGVSLCPALLLNYPFSEKISVSFTSHFTLLGSYIHQDWDGYYKDFEELENLNEMGALAELESLDKYGRITALAAVDYAIASFFYLYGGYRVEFEYRNYRQDVKELTHSILAGIGFML